MRSRSLASPFLRASAGAAVALALLRFASACSSSTNDFPAADASDEGGSTTAPIVFPDAAVGTCVVTGGLNAVLPQTSVDVSLFAPENLYSFSGDFKWIDDAGDASILLGCGRQFGGSIQPGSYPCGRLPSDGCSLFDDLTGEEWGNEICDDGGTFLLTLDSTGDADLHGTIAAVLQPVTQSSSPPKATANAIAFCRF